MTEEKLAKAKLEAERFLQRVAELEKIRAETPSDYVPRFPKEQAAVKRASMDLTRALAELRNN